MGNIQVSISCNPCIASFVQNDIPISGILSNLGKEIDKFYQNIAKIVIILENDGWKLEHFQHAVFAQHNDVHTIEQAKNRLFAIGVNIKDINIENVWQRIF